MNIFALIRIGNMKENCDDSVLIDSVVLNNEVRCIDANGFNCICVADGVGGNKGGKDASKYVLSKVANINLDGIGGSQLREKLLDINRELVDYGHITEDKKQMATTFTGIFKLEDGYYIAHIGNTRIYIKQGNYLKQITNDHTQYQSLIDRRMYREAELVNRSTITGCFGGGDTKYGEMLEVYKVFDNRLPEQILLTSDGIHDYLDIDILEEWLFKFVSEEDFKRVVSDSEARGSKDDKSIVIINNQ